MKLDNDVQVPLTRLIKKHIGPTISIDILMVLLERAGLGLHPDRILLSSTGHIEVQAGLPTPGYRAPDYQGGAPRPIHDVYVAGVILYELLTGQNLGQLPEREMLHSGALDRALNDLPQLSPHLRQTLKGMLAFRPETRLDAKLALNELKKCRPEGQGLTQLASVLTNERNASRSGATLIPGPSATLIPDAESPLPQPPTHPASPYQPLPSTVEAPKKANNTLIIAIIAGIIVLLCGGISITSIGILLLLRYNS